MISLIIPSLPGFEELNRECINSYQEHSNTDVEVVLIEKDRPFAQNVNEGLQLAKGDILCVVNNDSNGLPGWDQWVREATRGGAGIISFTPRSDCGWAFGGTKALWDELGLLDGNLVNSYEDYDLFIRAALRGYTRTLAPKHFAIHQGGVTIDTVWGNFRKQTRERLRQCHKNRDYMMKKWPGLTIDAVPTAWWVYNGIEVMKEWNKEHAVEA